MSRDEQGYNGSRMARRARGSGSAFYSEYDQCWVALVSLGTRNGKRVRKKARAATQRGAEVEAERIRREYQSGGAAMTMTLDAYMDDWLRDHALTVRPETVRSYQGHVDHHISPLLGGIRVEKLTSDDVRRLIRSVLAKGDSPATVGRVISTLHNALDVAVREGNLPRNVAAVKLPKVEREPIRAMTEEEAATLLSIVEGHPFEAVYRLLLGSGMRLGEALGLDWPDIHLDEGYVTLRVSKTQVRAVPISEDAVEALRAMDAGTGPVFVGPRKGKRLRGDVVYHAWQRLLIDNGLDRMRVHDLRHGVATLMLTSGANMRVVQEQLGHRSQSMTRLYAHVVPSAQRAAISALPRRKT